MKRKKKETSGVLDGVTIRDDASLRKICGIFLDKAGIKTKNKTQKATNNRRDSELTPEMKEKIIETLAWKV